MRRDNPILVAFDRAWETLKQEDGSLDSDEFLSLLVRFLRTPKNIPGPIEGIGKTINFFLEKKYDNSAVDGEMSSNTNLT